MTMNKAETAQRVGDALRVALTETRSNQRELAQRLGVAPATVSTWVQGQLPSVDVLVRIDRALGWRPGALLARAGVLAAPPLQETLEADPALDARGVQDVLSAHDRAVVATARRRSRNPADYVSPPAGLAPEMAESLGAQLLEASRGLPQLNTDVLQAAVAVLLSLLPRVASQDSAEIVADVTSHLPALTGAR